MDTYDFFLYLGYIMVIVAAVSAVLFSVLNMVTNPKNIIRAGISVAIIGVLFLIAYSMSGNEVTTEYAKFNIDPDTSKLVGGTLIMSYLLLGITVVGLFYTEVVKIVK
jgi:MFS-type transporter involved in bile tolerance (Atg22 family)